MKRIISVYIILMSLIGCGKFRETINGRHNQSEINQEEKQLNEQQPLNPDASDTSTSDASADTTQAPAANNKESWSEWTSRQWNENSGKWIGSIIGVAVVTTGLYFSYKWLKNRNAEQPPQPAVPENNIPNNAEAQPIDNGIVEQVVVEDQQEPEQQVAANPFINQQTAIVHEIQEEVPPQVGNQNLNIPQPPVEVPQVQIANEVQEEEPAIPHELPDNGNNENVVLPPPHQPQQNAEWVLATITKWAKSYLHNYHNATEEQLNAAFQRKVRTSNIFTPWARAHALKYRIKIKEHMFAR